MTTLHVSNIEPRQLIQAELSARISRNPRYSLRAFSRACGISHTVLSLVLSGKRPLSKKAATKLADFLDLDPTTRSALTTRRFGVDLNRKEREFQQLSLDTFTVISDWYHYGILSALELPNSRFEAGWLAKKLRITRLPAKMAMERLLRLKLVEQSKDGKWRQAGKPIKMGTGKSTEATRRFHKQLLQKAIESLENDPKDSRDFSSMTFAMDPAQIPYAKKRIAEFRRALMNELESAGNPKAVYNLTVQIYPITQLKSEESI